jgi:hypothetical protein
MSQIFYQANFCAECGNALEKRRGWRPRYFCHDCAARMRRRVYITPLSLLIGSLTMALGLCQRQSFPPALNELNHSPLANAPPAVSARDASPRQNPLPQTEEQESVTCGARTKKGAPCRRLVRPGRRCAQHQGMPSLLESKQKHHPRSTD